MTTDKTIKSKYQPKQTNVTWVDLSGEKPVEKHFINGRWQAIGGVGGGLSNPTETDATKVWQVTPVQKGTKTEEIIIVPEQTLTDDQEELEYNDKFVPGAQCVAVVNGVEYRREVVSDNKGYYAFDTEYFSFIYVPNNEQFVFINDTGSPEVTAKLSVIEETPIYDYNWAPGVKIPIPTAEDEGKILVVTKVEGDNTSIIVPEQEVPVDDSTPLTGVDLTKFVAGNTVKVTVIYEEFPTGNSQTFISTGVIEDDEGLIVCFDTNAGRFEVWKTDNLLYTTTMEIYGPDTTIKLEYIESNYEYQLQENGGGSSNILYCEGSYDGHGLITAYIDSSELDNPQITTIVVDTGDDKSYFYRMGGESWLVSGFASFVDSNEWIKEWNTEGQYPTIYAYFSQK